MASNDELRRLTAKLVSDADYRQRFSSDPEAAAREMGIMLNAEQLRRAKDFRGSDSVLEGLAAQATRGAAAWGAE
jgi:hypothetical protein